MSGKIKAAQRLADRMTGLIDEFQPWASKLWGQDELKRLPEQPDVPQADLPRYEPPRGASERAQALANDPAVWRKYDKLVDKGLQQGAGAWYNTEPLRKDFLEMNGPDGQRLFDEYMRYVAASSTGSAVPANARNASYYFTQAAKPEGLPAATPLPQPYGHKMQQNHLRQSQAAAAGEQWDVFKNPKPASFEQNLRGNWRPVTVDKHSTRGPAMLSKDPRWLLTQNAEDSARRPQDLVAGGTNMRFMGPTDYADTPNANEYGLLEEVFQDRARRMGVSPAQYQAGGWIGGGEMTGLGSPPLPFLQVLEDRVMRTATARGETPKKVYTDFLLRRAPLLGVGGMAAGGLLEEQAAD
jgi:hypothetical protein